MRLSSLLSPTQLRRLAAQGAEGAALGVAFWCIGDGFQVLPSALNGTVGVALAAVIGFGVGATRFRRALTILLGAAAATTVFVTLTFVSEAIAGHWVRSDPLPARPLDAILALSEGLNPDTTVANGALDHLLHAAELVRAGEAKLLVTTTTAEEFPSGFVSSDVDQRRVITMLGDSSVWLRTGATKTTRDEALQSAALLKPLGATRIGVVTSPMHTRRACATFEAVGFDVTCIASRMRGTDGTPLEQEPRDRMIIFGQWVYEVAAMAEYSARGWVHRRPTARDFP
jgi:uncharacterized SAM-binding protein YcdF (DUF218 family)